MGSNKLRIMIRLLSVCWVGQEVMSVHRVVNLYVLHFYLAHPTEWMHFECTRPSFAPNPTGRLDPMYALDSSSRPAESRGSSSCSFSCSSFSNRLHVFERVRRRRSPMGLKFIPKVEHIEGRLHTKFRRNRPSGSGDIAV